DQPPRRGVHRVRRQGLRTGLHRGDLRGRRIQQGCLLLQLRQPGRAVLRALPRAGRPHRRAGRRRPRPGRTGPRRARRRGPGHRRPAARPGLAAGQDRLPGARRPRPTGGAEPAGTPGATAPGHRRPALPGRHPAARRARRRRRCRTRRGRRLRRRHHPTAAGPGRGGRPGLAETTADRAAHRRPRRAGRAAARTKEGTVAMAADVIVVGAGLAGLVAAHQLTSRGRRVPLVDQETANNLGGQAFWSFGGLFLVDSPEQRRLRIKDSFDLAWSDWQGSAGFDRTDDEDSWAVRWARSYVEWAAGEKRSWLSGHGISFLPTVGWAERGDLRADGHGNTVPRFHIAWGTGTGVVDPFVRSARQAARDGLLTFHHRHRVDELVTTDGTVSGV